MGLLSVVFKSPPSLSQKIPREKLEEIFQNNSSIWGATSNLSETALEITDKMVDIKERRIIFILAGLLHNFVHYDKFPELKKSNLLEYHIKTSLKLNKRLMKSLNSVCEGVYKLRSLVEESKIDKENLGMFIREIQGYWPYSVYVYGEVFKEDDGINLRDKVFEMIGEANLGSFYKVKPIINVSFPCF